MCADGLFVWFRIRGALARPPPHTHNAYILEGGIAHALRFECHEELLPRLMYRQYKTTRNQGSPRSSEVMTIEHISKLHL